MLSFPAPPAPCVAYGDHSDQVANLHLPSREGGPWPCVVLVHGGFWRSGWDRTLMTPLAHDLARRGIAAWNIEYRRVGQEGGGWPGTFEDVAAAVDHLAELERSTRRGWRRAGTRPAGISRSGSRHATASRRRRRRRAARALRSLRSRRPASATSSARGATTSATVRCRGCWGRSSKAPSGSPPRRLPRSRRSASRSCSCTATEDDVVPVSQSRDYCGAGTARRSSSSSRAPTTSTWSTSSTAAWATARGWLSTRLGG